MTCAKLLFEGQAQGQGRSLTPTETTNITRGGILPSVDKKV